jgi:hypothetical protein
LRVSNSNAKPFVLSFSGAFHLLRIKELMTGWNFIPIKFYNDKVGEASETTLELRYMNLVAHWNGEDSQFEKRGGSSQTGGCFNYMNNNLILLLRWEKSISSGWLDGEGD